MKNIFYICVLFLLSVSNTLATNDLLWTDKIDDKFKNGWVDFVTKVDNIVWNLLLLVYFISVVFSVWWGFLIVTSGWDEAKVKKWKNFIIYTAIWLIVMFLASIFVRWIIQVMTSTDIVWK